MKGPNPVLTIDEIDIRRWPQLTIPQQSDTLRGSERSTHIVIFDIFPILPTTQNPQDVGIGRKRTSRRTTWQEKSKIDAESAPTERIASVQASNQAPLVSTAAHREVWAEGRGGGLRWQRVPLTVAVRVEGAKGQEKDSPTAATAAVQFQHGASLNDIVLIPITSGGRSARSTQRLAQPCETERYGR